jgi:hypothetical protein
LLSTAIRAWKKPKRLKAGEARARKREKDEKEILAKEKRNKIFCSVVAAE